MHHLSPGRTLTTLGVNGVGTGIDMGSGLHGIGGNGGAGVGGLGGSRGRGRAGGAGGPAHLSNLIVPTIRTIRYNRRNNPELEKRRIHHCDFEGEFGA